MTQDQKVRQYLFHRGTIPGTIQLLESDQAVVKSMEPGATKVSLERRLRTALRDKILEPYISAVMNSYLTLVQDGSISDETSLRGVGSSLKTEIGEYWGTDIDEVQLEVLPVSNMLEGEIEAGEKLMKEVGHTSQQPDKPSPSFFDHLEQKAVVSDQYIFTDPRGETHQYSWDKGVFKTVVAIEMGRFAIRKLRGETGDGYLQMLRNLPPYMVVGVQTTVAAANSYADAEILKGDGVPVLYRRLLDIYTKGDEFHIINMSMKALGDDLGIRTAALFDEVHAVPGTGIVSGMLWTAHPNYENRKETIQQEAAKTLNYPIRAATISEAALRPPRG